VTTDQNLHKYMEISQSFNDSKSLLGGASESIRYFLSHLDSRIDRSLKEYETIVNKESK
jgi:hypothetical protein